METENNVEIKQITSAQDVLVKKVLKSSKFKDAEYRSLKAIYDNQVTTSYDASVFIEYILAAVKFRRIFLNGKHKAYKKCFYCNDRNQVERYLRMSNGLKAWVCPTCAVNLDPSKYVPVKVNEDNEVKCDLFRKENPESVEEDSYTTRKRNLNEDNLYKDELTSAQEDLINEHREE